MMSNESPVYDVIIIGAGLGGLSTALHLQQENVNVLLLEKNKEAGGLCGTYHDQGDEYVIACNDFGVGLLKLLKPFNLGVKFEKRKTCIYHKRRKIFFPLNISNLFFLLKNGKSLFQYIKNINNKDYKNFTLKKFMSEVVTPSDISDILKIPAYFMGVSPEKMPIKLIKFDREYKYGYSQPITPIGGPKYLVDKMVSKIKKKGDIHLGTKCFDINTQGKIKCVKTNNGNFYSKNVVITMGKQRLDSTKYDRGLPLSQFRLILDKKFILPKKIHTHVYYPPNIDKWFSHLENGIDVDDFGFHFFSSHLKNNKKTYAANIYFYLPKGVNKLNDKDKVKYQTFILLRLEEMLPGINNALQKISFIGATDFIKLHGIESRVTPLITPAEINKPNNYDAKTDLYYAGASVHPPGDHAGASILSGAIVSNLLVK